MKIKILLVLLVLFSFICLSVAKRDEEPMCTSRFDFEEKLLHKMVKMEHAMEVLKTHVDKQLTALVQEKTKLAESFAEFQLTTKKEQSDVLTQITEIQRDVKTSVDALDDKLIRNGISPIDEPVVFSVTVPRTSLVNGVPVFQTVLVNEGGAYDVSTGKFTCRVNGIYSFTFTVRSSARGYVYCRIKRKNKELNYAISEGINDMGSVTVYTKLQIGDDVTVTDCSNWSNNAGSPTSFSGYLMFRT